MHKEVLSAIEESWEKDTPELTQMAADATPASLLQSIFRKMSRKWLKRFDVMAPKLAKYFATNISRRSDRALAKILRDAGITVNFTPTKAQRDALDASIAGQVSLIKSIPTQYLQRVEGQVMRSVQAGHDIGTLTQELKKDYSLTYNRAALIAKDQNAKAASTMLRVRQLELGLNKAIWRHSGGGKTPRPLHVKWGRERKQYDIAKGMWDSKEKKWIQPGELINCKCVSQTVIPGLV